MIQTLRPRWPSLYAARKRRLEPKISLPALPNSFLGWMPKLYRITEQEVLAAAGLDAFVVGIVVFFLNFVLLTGLVLELLQDGSPTLCSHGLLRYHRPLSDQQ